MMDERSISYSPLHRFDPRAKVISFLSLIFSVAFVRDIRVALACFVAVLLLLIVSRIPLHALNHLKAPSLFIIFLLVTLPITVEGTVLFRFYIIKVTYEGLYEGVLVALRAFTAIILAFLLVSTSKFDDIIKALRSLHFPKTLTQMLMLSYRYVFVFSDEMARMLTAMQARGFRIEARTRSLKALGKALGMLFVRASERSERVYEAMLSRGYTGNPRTISNFSMHARDYALCTLSIAFAVLLHVPLPSAIA